MRSAHTVEQVRAAEAELMARLPEGALMQRAATGLATVCVRLLGSVYGRRVVLLVGTGNNGGDALFAGTSLARRGARVTAVLLDPDRVHAAGLAARFAAKEALAKALGAPGDLLWHDAEVVVGERGRPHLEVRGTVAERAAELGVTSWHVSLSHDGGIASAVVVAEGLTLGAGT